MKNTSLIKPLFLFALLFTAFAACKRNEPDITVDYSGNINAPVNSYNPPAVTFKATVQGFVVDTDGNAVSGAKVSAGGRQVTADFNGAFTINDADFTGNFCYIKAEKGSFFTASNTVRGTAGNTFQTTLTMLPLGAATVYNAAEAKDIKLQDGSIVSLPAHAVQSLNGKPYEGNVRVNIAHLDPKAPNFSSLIPGGDLRAFNAAQQDVQLYSYGMLNVELRDNAGNLLQLDKGKTAKLTMPVPASMIATAPATIPLWYFDEKKGVWIEDGSGTLNGNIYEGTVSHFTAWNFDRPTPPAFVKGRVVDANGNPIRNVSVFADQCMTQSATDGTFSFRIVAGEEAEVDIFDESTRMLLGLNKVVPPLASGQTYDIGDLKFSTAELTAVIKNCDGSPFTGYALLKYSTYRQKAFISNSQLSLAVATNGSAADLIIYNADVTVQNTQAVTLPTIKEKKNLGEIRVCDPAVVLNSISFTYDNGVDGLQTVQQVNSLIAGYYCGTTDTPAQSHSQIFISDDDPKNGDPRRFFDFQMIGKGLGTFTITGTPGNDLMIFHWVDGYALFAKNITLTITKFGNVGEEVSGTFSGTAVDDTGKAVTITNGKFKVIRQS